MTFPLTTIYGIIIAMVGYYARWLLGIQSRGMDDEYWIIFGCCLIGAGIAITICGSWYGV